MRFRVINRFTGEILPALYTSRELAERAVDRLRPRNRPGNLGWKLNPYDIQQTAIVRFTDGTTEERWGVAYASVDLR